MIPPLIVPAPAPNDAQPGHTRDEAGRRLDYSGWPRAVQRHGRRRVSGPGRPGL